MTVRRIDHLIEIALNAADKNLDRQEIGKWKAEALAYLTEHLGHGHHYTLWFEDYLREADRENLLAGGGLLAAAKEEISNANRFAGAWRWD